MDNTKRKILIGLAQKDKQPTSRQFLRKYGIESVSTSGSAVKRLVNTGVVVKDCDGIFRIEDPFWGKWILVNRQ